jgi:predicted nucleic-acid-binding Zn-ribbon protein
MTKDIKVLNWTYIQCSNCKYIVPYKAKVRKFLIPKTLKCTKCNRCDNALDTTGKRYYDM